MTLPEAVSEAWVMNDKSSPTCHLPAPLGSFLYVTQERFWLLSFIGPPVSRTVCRALPETQLSAQLSNCLEILNLFQPACLLQAGHLPPAWSMGGQTQGRSVSPQAEAQRHACWGMLGFGQRIGSAPDRLAQGHGAGKDWTQQ